MEREFQGFENRLNMITMLHLKTKQQAQVLTELERLMFNIKDHSTEAGESLG